MSGGGGGGECHACQLCSAGQVGEYEAQEDEAGLESTVKLICKGFSRLDFP